MRKTRYLAFVVILALLGLGGVRSVVLAQDGGTGPPPVGGAVPVVGVEGSEAAQITVTEVEDPFEDYDPNVPPERSYHFVLLHIDVENTGSRPYAFNSYGITLQDADGFLYQQIFLYRPEEQVAADPEFTSEAIEAGDTVSGVIGFQVLDGAELVRIVFQPAFDRLIFLADLTVEGAAPPPNDADDAAAATPAAADDDATADSDSDTADAAADTDAETDTDTDTEGDADTETDTETAVDADANEDADADVAAVEVSDEECDDVQTWLDDVTPELEVLEETLDAIFADDPVTPETLSDAAADLEDAAVAIRDSDPPAAIEDAATALADALDAYAAAYAAAADAGDDIPLLDFGAEVDTSEADAFLDDVGDLSTPVLDAFGIEG